MLIAMEHPAPTSRSRILDAALEIIRTKGYASSTVDNICEAAKVTKGGFFHHFENKEDLAICAAEHFGNMAHELFSQAPYRQLPDPLLRFLGYIDFRIAILKGELPHYTCLLGTMVQEVYTSHPAIRDACERQITAHVAEIAEDIALARDYYVPDADWQPESLALFTQSVLQGAFILAKARNGPEVAVESVRHLKRYVEMLFHVLEMKEESHAH